MNITGFRQVIAVVAVAVATGSANAALIDHGTTTLDTATGFEWLDVTATAGRSHDDVAANFAPGGNLAGYRYASEAELVTFWTHAGIPDVGSSSLANQAPITALMALIGVTVHNPTVDGTFGLTGTAEATEWRVSLLSNDPDASAFPFSFSEPGTAASSNIGSYIITPEPASMTALLAGSSVLLRRRRA